MIAYLNGTIQHKCPTYFIIEVNGVGYQVHISLNTYSKLQNSTACKIFTHLHIQEDAHTMYGFADELERQIFLYLISISGVGPSTARMVLSSMAPEDVQQAIAHERADLLEKVKGIGPKTAKRIVLELKDKMLKVTDASNVAWAAPGGVGSHKQEALSALVALGFARQQSENAINKVLTKAPDLDSVEAIIKAALQAL